MSPAQPELEPFVEAQEASGDATAFVCSLCGARFTHGTLVCRSCPLNAGCEVVKCPSCGYQFPRRSRIVDIVRRLLGVGVRK